MAGTQIFTRFNVGKETTRGTPVAPTRQLYGEGTGVLTPDFGLNFHEGENAGRRTDVRRVTSTSEDVSLSFRSVSGIGYDDLVVPFSQLKGGVSGTGAGTDKTWTFTPSYTAANSPEAYSIDVGDDTQNWRCQYAMARSFKLSAARGDVTALEMDMFAQRAVKGAAASPAVNNGIKIPGDLWTIKVATTIAGLGAASVQANWLLDWELEVTTGLQWRHYLDGNLYGGQHQETRFSGLFTARVESTALAISEVFDKSVAGTMSAVRMKATGPSLGSSNYSAQIDFPVLWEVPQPITEEEDGINIYAISGRLTDDGTNFIVPVIVNSLAALP